MKYVKYIPPISIEFFIAIQCITVPVHEIIISFSVQSSKQSTRQGVIGFGWKHINVDCLYPSVVP